ncbi:MAG: 50S ribosomal protein L10 [Bifidobacteriaceae bacterium]|jgi:large subunit ribosomal protein L10|nr:50S ribosomal protein L10 [Bifidobacteriaceae bacterium]
MASPAKIEAVKKLEQRFSETDALFVTQYRGLSVANLKELRNELGSDTSYDVVKNTLAKIAAKNAGINALDPDILSGPVAIAFVKGEAVDAAKALKKFSDEHEALVIMGGIFEGNALGKEGVISLASLESREVLLAKFAGAAKANVSKAAYCFVGVQTKAAQLFQALAEKKNASGEFTN